MTNRNRRGTLGLLTGAAPTEDAPAEDTAAPAADAPQDAPQEPAAAPKKAAPPAPRKGRDKVWEVTDSETSESLGRVEAPTRSKAVIAAQVRTGLSDGFMIQLVKETTGESARPAGREATRPAAPAPMLPRVRSKRIPKDKLTVQLPVAVLDALSVLVDRDGTLRYQEVEEALRKHMASKKIKIEEGS